jgi:cell division protein FtsX
MIRHALSEGALLVRKRLVITVVLGVLLAVPLALSAVTATTVGWLNNLAAGTADTISVPVLLRPELDAASRAAWVERQRQAHPEWMIRTVPSEELVDRLGEWFPSLATVLDEDRGLLPPLVEITSDSPSLLGGLEADREVLAVGPLDPFAHQLGRASRELATGLGVVCLALLLGAAVLAAVWVHLELYRHADELEIMRLVGAREGAIRGPFLVAVSAPGVVAAVIAPLATVTALDGITHLADSLGLQPMRPSPWLLAAEVAVALALPVAAAWFTLQRHSRLGLADV